jgi:DNA-directed RNA polymerase
LEKGLLRFSVKKPLSSASAIRWFKTHGANKFGLDKETIPDRIKWVDDNHEFITAIAADPLAAYGWTEADDPVQFLAWAIEYGHWTADPGGFVSALPMSQDGTCNGLQHFSALMCDAVGGAAVNLIPGPAPRDIYSDVAVRVIERLDEAAPSPIRDGWLGHMNQHPKAQRKITKRPTMTLPYGSTRFAASTFIADYIEDRSTPPLIEIEPAEWGNAANYLSHTVWASLGEVVVKAMEVMEWLKGWAKHASQTDKGVRWVTPSGLNVTSEYEGMKVRTVKSVAFKTRIRLYEPAGKDDLKKIMNAVAPNFVHSLDASHMAAVVAQAELEGMTMATIHDDFGVHAADTERFQEIIRQKFVEQYDGNTLLMDMQMRTGYSVPPPPLGDLNLKDVIDSVYFFA